MAHRYQTGDRVLESGRYRPVEYTDKPYELDRMRDSDHIHVLSEGANFPKINERGVFFELEKAAFRFGYFQSKKNGQWYWHLKAGNNKIIASSAGDGYNNRQDCMNGLNLVRNHASEAIDELIDDPNAE